MRLVPVPRTRLQQIAREFAKFGTVGIVNTVLNYAVFNALILTVFTHGQLKASVVATVIATTVSYFMNRHWTYRDRPKSALRREYVLFFAFNLAGLLIELSALGLAKYGLGLTSLIAINVAKTIGLGLGTIFRFWAYRTFVFPPPAADDPAAELEEIVRDEASTSAALPGQPVPPEPDFAELAALEAELAAELDAGLETAEPEEANAARHHR